MLSTRKRGRARRREGVALTEALLAIGMLILLLAGVSFFHSMYAAKEDTMQRARLQAWAATRMQCGDTDVRGNAQLAVAVPSPILMNAGGPGQRTVKSGTLMSCNIEPGHKDDVVSVVGWAVGEGGSIADAFVSAGADIAKAVVDGVVDLLNPLNWF